MSLKVEIEITVDALKAYDAGDYDTALQKFEQIADSSKVFFNMGMIHATRGEHEQAISNYVEATNLDQYLAIAYFQEGVSNFLLAKFEDALANFNDALLYLRGNICINYEQLGLKFKLYSCEVLFNRGLSYIYSGNMEEGMQDLNYAVKEKQTDEHNVIDEAIRDQAEGYTVFSVPVGVLYRPSEAKIKNAQKKDYLGQAKLIAATDAKDGFTGFTGAEIKKASEPVRSPTTTTSPSVAGSNSAFATHQMVKTDLAKSKSTRERARSDADISTTSDPTSKRDRFAQPFPVKQGGAAQMKQYLPPTPPSESDLIAAREERQMIRSRSQPATSTRMSSRTDRSSGSSDYTPPPRPRLNSVRDEEESSIRRTKSTRATPQMGRSMSRSQSRREPFRGRRRNNEDEEGVYDIYDDYYDEKSDSLAPTMPGRSATLRRMDTRTSRSRNSSTSRGGRSRNEDDDYGGVYSDEDDEFEMITPKRSEITKIKVKVKMAETAKIVMIPLDIEIREFMDRVANKFSVSTRRLKCTFRDEDGQMMDLSDQDELEMLIELAKEDAKLNRREFGRAEVTCSA